MKIIYQKKTDSTLFPGNLKADVHLVCVQIVDIQKCAQGALSQISDMSWIKKLDAISQATYEARVQATVKDLIKMFREVDNVVTSDFGEFMVSLSASEGLRKGLNHKAFPISELW